MVCDSNVLRPRSLEPWSLKTVFYVPLSEFFDATSFEVKTAESFESDLMCSERSPSSDKSSYSNIFLFPKPSPKISSMPNEVVLLPLKLFLQYQSQSSPNCSWLYLKHLVRNPFGSLCPCTVLSFWTWYPLSDHWKFENWHTFGFLLNRRLKWRYSG